jgi:hypothetical protein
MTDTIYGGSVKPELSQMSAKLTSVARFVHNQQPTKLSGKADVEGTLINVNTISAKLVGCVQ